MKADWISVDEALRIILDNISPGDTESLPLMEARGRFLAADLVSTIELPRWTNSAMDGFAVHSADIAGATASSPVELPIVDDIAAGGFPRGPLQPGHAARIMTGAPVPEGADTVVRVEDTDGGRSPDATLTAVRIFSDQDAGRNLRPKGEEISSGAVALRKGAALVPGAIGVAASLGAASVEVVRKPRVAILTSGEELVHVEEFAEVAAGRKIVSSNSYTLQAAVDEAGGTPDYLGIAADRPDSLHAALTKAAGSDVLITSAGISVGEHDHVKRVLRELETDVKFWRVKMRPGSPFAFGLVGGLGGIPWFGLPGNPVSSAVTFEMFVRPALRRIAGAAEIHRRTVDARFVGAFDAPAGLTQLLRVRLQRGTDGVLEARLTGRQGSGMLMSVAAADGLMVVPENERGAVDGGIYRVIPLAGGMCAPELDLTLPARTRL